MPGRSRHCKRGARLRPLPEVRWEGRKHQSDEPRVRILSRTRNHHLAQKVGTTCHIWFSGALRSLQR
jgi:hypothetical protein